ncbi:MAG: primase [Amycolatopsis sp.]|uniref:bifunctional DNA primase/polymerase n=1 Tax=Amycolatopsis sp. TaxID=37632 RepID=UPI0026205D0E|nr:bifunctional DNA primase/polymerase [Amycolatopsis sp.]MCU1685790.1 primase [Amycolatopsis sp.]
MDTPDTPMLHMALYLAAMGWPIFPLRPGSKQPAGHDGKNCPGTGQCADGHSTWEKRATTDTDRITRCWSGIPWNIGIATGPAGLAVVDLDAAKDGDDRPDGVAALAALADERGGPVPDTFVVITPSGGRHLYYTAPAGTRLRNTQGHIAPHIDTRAGGGYVVGPGSVTEAGTYEFLDDYDPAELPGWLVQVWVERPVAASTAPVLLRSADTTAYGAAALRGECDRVRGATAGTCNEVVSSAAYTVGRKVGGRLIDHAAARADLIAAGETLVGPEGWPHDVRDLARVVDAGLKAGAENKVTHRGRAS